MPARPVSKNHPLITIKLHEVMSSGSVGTNIQIDLQVLHISPVYSVGLHVRDKWLCQQAINPQEQTQIVIRSNIMEKDPVYSESSGNQELQLNIDFTKHRVSGTENQHVTLEAVGGDQGKQATFTLTFQWWQSPSVLDVIAYIHGEMITNIESSAFQQIHDDLASANGRGGWPIFQANIGSWNFFDAATRNNTSAMIKWKDMVGYDQPWDHKEQLKKAFGDWSLDGKRGMLYHYDSWSNIHYGYVGRAAGFPDWVLLAGAGYAQALNDHVSETVMNQHIMQGTLHELDQPSDQAAITIGMGLWKKYGARVTMDNILTAVRRQQKHITTKQAEEGIPPRRLY